MSVDKITWAHRHRNPDGTEGGWVADTAILGSDVQVAPTAIIGDYAHVGFRAVVGDKCIIGAHCRIDDFDKVPAGFRCGDWRKTKADIKRGSGERYRGWWTVRLHFEFTHERIATWEGRQVKAEHGLKKNDRKTAKKALLLAFPGEFTSRLGEYEGAVVFQGPPGSRHFFFGPDDLAKVKP